MFTTADLEAFKTPEEYATYQNEVRGRMQELDSAFAGRAMDEDARAEFASLQDLDKDVAKTITELQGRRDYLASLAKNPANVERPFAGRTIVTSAKHVPDDVFAIEQYRSLSSSEAELLQGYRDGAMFAVERATYPNPKSVKPTEQAHIQGLLDNEDLPSPTNPNRELARRILATGSPAYLRAFTDYIKTGRMDLRAVGAWTVQTDATGGFAVPFAFDPTMLHTGAWTNINPYRQVCNVKTIVGTDTYQGVSTTSFVVARAGEAVATTEGLGAVAQISIITSKVNGAGKVSIELTQDRPDIFTEIASIISEAKDTEEEASFATADGGTVIGRPLGIGPAHGTSNRYAHTDTLASAGVIAAADYYRLEAALPVRHRFNSVWFLERSFIRIAQLLETAGGPLFGSTGGYPAVGPINTNSGGNTGLNLLGHPVYESPSLPTWVDTNDLVAGVLFDPSTYYIVERAGMSVEVIPHFLDATSGYPTGERIIYAYWRNSAKPVDVAGGQILTLLT